MNFALLIFVLPALLVAGLLYFMPVMTRRGIFFSATVADDFAASADGRRLLRDFRMAWLLWTVIAVAAAFYLASINPAMAALLPMAVLLGGNGFVYWRKFHEVHDRYGIRPPELRQASLNAAPSPSPFSPWIVLPPFLALAAVAWYLHAHWDALPLSFPIHWDAAGQPNRWAERTWRGVYGPVFFGAYLDLLLLGLAWLLAHETRKSVMRHVTVRAVQFLLYPLSFNFIMMALLPLTKLPVWLSVLMMFACVIGIVIWAFQKITAPMPVADETPEPQSDAYWKAGVLYWNSDDPAIFVAKRVGIGYTINFANKWSWITLAALLLAILLPSFLLVRR